MQIARIHRTGDAAPIDVYGDRFTLLPAIRRAGCYYCATSVDGRVIYISPWSVVDVEDLDDE